MTAGRTAAQVIGAVLAAIAVAILVSGVAAVAIAGANRDTDGYLTTPAYELSAEGHAVTFGAADVQSSTDGWVPWRGLFSTRASATATDGGRVFIGIGPADDVAAYLADVEHTRVSDLGIAASHVELDDEAGSATPERPGAQDFWVVQNAGPGKQTIEWEPSDGSWSVVVMNADGSSGVDVTAGGGVSIGVLWPVGLALLVAGVLTLLVAIALLVAGSARRRATPRPAGPAIAPAP